MKKKINAVAFLILATALFSCGGSPEGYGKELAEKFCKCDEMKEDIEYNADKKKYEMLLDELKDNKMKRRSDYNNRQRDLQSVIYNKDEEENVKKCEEDMKKEEKEAMLKYVKDEDRRTFLNAAQAKMEAYNDKKREKNKERNEKLNAIKTEVNDLAMRLPYY